MMTSDLQAIPRIPRETAMAAGASFGRGNFYIQVGEHLDSIYSEIGWARFAGGVDTSRAEDRILPLITFFQFMEGLTDLQAIDAVRTRTDWKFSLHLSLLPRVPHESELCEFRQRIVRDAAGQREYQVLIDRLVRFTPSLSHVCRPLSSLGLVSLVCSLNRLNQAQQVMKGALEVLAIRFPQWLRQIALPHWYGRYNPAIARLDVAILLGQQRFLMEEIGSDIQYLLERVHEAGPRAVGELHEIKVLEQVWSQQFQAVKQAGPERLEFLNHKDCEDCSHGRAEGRH